MKRKGEILRNKWRLRGETVDSRGFHVGGEKGKMEAVGVGERTEG